jgi:ATP-dependent Clp protease protease subunit
MLHQPLGGFRGQASDIAIHAKEILDVKRRLTNIYCDHIGKSRKEIESVLERDTFFSASEAVDFNIIDGIISPKK